MKFGYYFTHLLSLTKWEKMNVPTWYETVASLIIVLIIIIIISILLGNYFLVKKYLKRKNKDSICR
ncbi:hypothetical protein LT336_00744 [Spiroplasma sp. JKS002671]|nr:hypothetical protein [Spiroplasma sp. JKS002671]MCL8210992.1 hypothetical protein [Spiroplasma sp. JKS002671]